MNSQSVWKLGLLVIALLGGLLIVNLGTDDRAGGDSELLFPGLKDRMGDIRRVTISSPDHSVTLELEQALWRVVERDNYPADTVALRELVLALAEATRLEQKTSNPDRYAQLGVDEGEAATGTRVSLSGDDLDHSVIVGNKAQSKYRYARIAGQKESWLISEDPDVAAGIGGWLEAEIVDIDAAAVRAVTLQHADGETIRLFKDAEGDANFQVADIPQGRELSYATVADGMGGVLKGLILEDVRALPDAPPEAIATTRFELFDGSALVVHSHLIADEPWIAVTEVAADNTGGTGAAEVTGDAAAADAWLYKIADYKKNLLVRRWDDILKAAE